MALPPFAAIRFRCAVLLALTALLPPFGGAHAETAPLPEYTVKAAFLLNIAKYANWPAHSFADSAAPIVIGILGEDPFGPALERLVHGRVINDRKIAVRRSKRAADLRGAHVVFLSASENDRASSACALLADGGALCVGDTEGTAPFTSINFSVEGGRVVFSVNLVAARRSNIAFSSRLLHLAKSVVGSPIGEKERP